MAPVRCCVDSRRNSESDLLVHRLFCLGGVTCFVCGGMPLQFYRGRAAPFACEIGFFTYCWSEGCRVVGLGRCMNRCSYCGSSVLFYKSHYLCVGLCFKWKFLGCRRSLRSARCTVGLSSEACPQADAFWHQPFEQPADMEDHDLPNLALISKEPLCPLLRDWLFSQDPPPAEGTDNMSRDLALFPYSPERWL